VFSFLYSEQKKMRQNAGNWLEVADRVYNFRRDQLTEGQAKKLLVATGEVKLRLKERADTSRIKSAVESLEAVLQDTGGRVYPVSSMIENVEFFLVAAIVILGLRAYFVQPFKIPTNSMWPTYYGMTSEVFPAGQEPGPLGKVARLLTLGATNYSVTAPADGEVYIGVFGNGQYLQPAYSEKAGRSMFIFPANLKEFVFSVGGETARVTVPADFDYGQVVEQAFFKGQAATLDAALRKAAVQAQPLERSTILLRGGVRPLEVPVYWIPIGRKVQRGDKLLSFDILTGDLLFVDRLTYNFFPPHVGSGFVFKTGNIEELKSDEGDKYFIKRLVGVPGDKLEIRKPAPLISDGAPPVDSKDGQLFRNGQPIDGSAAFGKNSRKDGLYPGYTADGRLAFGQVVSVPNNSYFAMGDNSPRSKDSRYWGYVPDKDVVGRPLFIYYPLTSRWGPAK
jgi:signal peptidase I